MAFTISDGLLIAATFVGPIVAVQVQKFLERVHAEQNRREKIFKTLMATRAVRLSPSHVEALNMIDIEFPSKSGRFKEVRSAWKAYFTHLQERPPDDPQTCAVYFGARPGLFTEVLFQMSKVLNYDFDKTQISKDVYSTIFHENLEADLQTIRTKLVEVLSGKAAIDMRVVGFPVDADVAASQAEYLKFMVQNIREGKPFRVEVVSGENPTRDVPSNELRP